MSHGEGEHIERAQAPEERARAQRTPFSLRRALGYGVAVWLAPVAAQMVFSPLRDLSPALFRSLVIIAFVIVVVRATRRYLIDFMGNAVREGLNIGALWLLLACALDIFLVVFCGFHQASFADYLANTGIFYFLIPVITYGSGRMIEDHAPDERRPSGRS